MSSVEPELPPCSPNKGGAGPITVGSSPAAHGLECSFVGGIRHADVVTLIAFAVGRKKHGYREHCVHMNRVPKALFRVPESHFSPMLMLVLFTVPASQRPSVHMHLVSRPVSTPPRWVKPPVVGTCDVSC